MIDLLAFHDVRYIALTAARGAKLPPEDEAERACARLRRSLRFVSRTRPR